MIAAKTLMGDENYSDREFAGLHLTDAGLALGKYDWDGCWPVSTTGGVLTGEVLGIDPVGYHLSSWDGDTMIPGDNDMGCSDAWVAD
jgi:hypothetical protein